MRNFRIATYYFCTINQIKRNKNEKKTTLNGFRSVCTTFDLKVEGRLHLGNKNK